MTNRTRALGQRIIGALRNENVLVIAQPSTGSVTVCNAKTGKTIYTTWYDSTDGDAQFLELIWAIKAAPSYPAPKERKQYGAPRARHTQTTGVSMSRFVPGLSMGMGE